LQRARNGRLLGTPRPPKGALHRRIEANGAIALGDGLGPTEDTSQAIEHLLDGAIADHLLGDVYLFPQRGKKTVSPQILSQGTEAGTAGRHHAIFRHGELLSAQGIYCIAKPLMKYSALQEFALQVL